MMPTNLKDVSQDNSIESNFNRESEEKRNGRMPTNPANPFHYVLYVHYSEKEKSDYKTLEPIITDFKYHDFKEIHKN